jgi:hypothetical protein
MGYGDRVLEVNEIADVGLDIMAETMSAFPMMRFDAFDANCVLIQTRVC